MRVASPFPPPPLRGPVPAGQLAVDQARDRADAGGVVVAVLAIGLAQALEAAHATDGMFDNDAAAGEACAASARSTEGAGNWRGPAFPRSAASGAHSAAWAICSSRTGSPAPGRSGTGAARPASAAVGPAAPVRTGGRRRWRGGGRPG